MSDKAPRVLEERAREGTSAQLLPNSQCSGQLHSARMQVVIPEGCGRAESCIFFERNDFRQVSAPGRQRGAGKPTGRNQLCPGKKETVRCREPKH